MRIFFVRASVQIVLLVVALNYFGLPSLRRFFDMKVVVTSADEDQKNFPSPSVTVCPRNPLSSQGFPKYLAGLNPDDSTLGNICMGKDDIANCIENNTFDLESTVALYSDKSHFSMGTSEPSNLWTPDFTIVQVGMCYTLNGLNITTFPFLEFNKNNTYSILLHDPNLFHITFNFLMPTTRISIEKLEADYWQFNFVQHRKLNRPSAPCNTSPSYSFTACVKAALSGAVGCRLPWDGWTHPSLPICNSIDQYRWLRPYMLAFYLKLKVNTKNFKIFQNLKIFKKKIEGEKLFSSS